MKLSWEGEAEDAAAAAAARARLGVLQDQRGGQTIVIANEFSDMRVSKVNTRNGVRLLIESPKSGQWITLDALELEALTWQNETTLSAMVGRPFQSLLDSEDSGNSEEDS